MTRTRALIAAGLLAAGLAAAAWLSTSRVPDGSLGLHMRADRAVALLPPGRHLKGPLDTVRLLPAGPREYSGDIHLTTPEGAAVALPFRMTVDFTRADPKSLSPLAAAPAAGSGGGLDEAIAAVVQREAGMMEGGGSASLPAAALAPRLAGIGLVPGSLVVGDPSTVTPARSGNPLRASFKPPAAPIVIIGIDGADWDLMTPMMESGALPHLRSLRDRGAWGTLRSMQPTLSPILWTTVVTGRPPEEHGVMDFLMKDPATGAEVPISRFFRRVKALWNIASDLDLPTLTVGWWATWPAEAVNGQMVTDRVAFSLFDLPSGDPPVGLVHPESLRREVLGMRVDEDEIGFEDVRAIADLPAGEFERARLAVGSLEGYKDPVSHLIRILASTRTYHRIATTLLSRRKPGLALVYYEGLDEVSHRFAHYMPPAMRMTRSTPAPLASAYAGAVPGFYRLQDQMVGDLVRAAGPGARFIVLSDHGFANGAERPVDQPPDIEGKPGLWHTLDGVFIAAGPGVRPRRLPEPVTLLDITPTVLGLLGLPKGADMPGRVITEMLEPEASAAIASVRVDSYDDIGEPLQTAGAGASSGQDAEMMAKLAALGYIQSGEGAPIGTGTPTYHVNAGRIFLAREDLDRARDEFEKARALAPRFDQPLLGLAQVELASGRPAAAIPFLEDALSLSDQPQPALFTRAALVYSRAGRPRDGISFLESLHLRGAPEAYRLTALGMLREKEGDSPGALRAYLEALDSDPAVSRALEGAYRLMKRGGDLERLAGVLERGAGAESVSVSVRASNWLALTRELQGDAARAKEILREALAKAPDDVMTLTNLGSMLVREDRAPEGLPYLERAYERRPRSLEILVNLVVGYGKAGRLDQARRYFAEGESAGARPELLNAIAYACFLNGAIGDASGYISRSLALEPSQAEARRLKEEIDRSGGL